ncbi:MAG: hypothetical protein JWL59_4697 [Chthoniobacteraceae bacterium]|nr:hypothetical protein [Chthoniobacteraceae bacterium]
MPKRNTRIKHVSKTPTGITGFDEITNGGLPKARLTLIMGSTGSGKTVFALQTLVNGARNYDEPGIFVAFEENADQIVDNAASFTWGLREFENKKVFIYDARVTPDLVKGGDFDLTGILVGIKTKAIETGAKRIAFDSIDVLLSLLSDLDTRRQEIYRLCDWLVTNEFTGLLTMKMDANDEVIDCYAFVKFHSDCVVMLAHCLVNHFSMRQLQVVKYRGSAHSDNQTSFVILSTGIEVAASTSHELKRPASTAHVSTGIKQLDTMLHGGYYRSSSVLLTGPPGTAKSTIASAFTQAACLRNERTLYVAFDENAEGIERNMASVNLHLPQYRRSGLLYIYAARTEAISGPMHLMKIKSIIDEFQPKCLVIDPISSLIRAGGEKPAAEVAERLLYLSRARGITIVCTSLADEKPPLLGNIPIHVGTIVDVWIHVGYFIQNGERNRSLSIVKSRGMKHSNRICEMILTDEGISLTDVYVSQGMWSWVIFAGNDNAPKKPNICVPRPRLKRCDRSWPRHGPNCQVRLKRCAVSSNLNRQSLRL